MHQEWSSVLDNIASSLSLYKVLAVPLNSVFRRERIITFNAVLERIWSKETLLINAMNSLAGSNHINTEFHYYFPMFTLGTCLPYHLRGRE